LNKIFIKEKLKLFLSEFTSFLQNRMSGSDPVGRDDYGNPTYVSYSPSYPYEEAKDRDDYGVPTYGTTIYPNNDNS
jgi:hypothetical protein